MREKVHVKVAWATNTVVVAMTAMHMLSEFRFFQRFCSSRRLTINGSSAKIMLDAKFEQ
jgi:hypothetical protein